MTRGFSRLRREDLLKTACEVIATQGFGNTRTVDIARAAGVSQALLFYHFETKEQLIAEAFAFAARQHLDAIGKIERSPQTPVERLRALIRLCSPGSSPAGWRIWIDAWSESMRNPELEATTRRMDVHGRNVLKDIITSGVACGEFACVDPEASSWRIFALIDGLAVQLHVHHKIISRRKVTLLVRTAAAMEVGLTLDLL
ncbi:TetR/AcrR family transcriptional regulator [Nonomuraea typhae]|uniref:TetR/AcrR family transcriptional regulator n=1 Tax=Nonomuraea typhae TaxID=2603600 RepID=A0ABW7YLB2_9ACTN